MYVDIVISNIFYLNKHFFFFLSFLSFDTVRQGIITGLICATVVQSCRVMQSPESTVYSVDSWYMIQWRSWTECRVQNNGAFHGVCIDERATDGTFHEVSMQHRRTRSRSWINSRQSWVEHFEFVAIRKHWVRRTRKTLSSTYTRTVWVRRTQKIMEQLCCLTRT